MSLRRLRKNNNFVSRRMSKDNTKKAVREKGAFFAFGMGKERDYLLENLSLLISSGMSILSALDAMAEEPRSRRMEMVLSSIREDIGAGFPLWEALLKTHLFPEHAISLIKLGEESGKFAENLKVVVVEQEKNRTFQSKLRSAMMYPVFVLSLTLIIGISIAWFILPKLATVFSQLRRELPLITKILIKFGAFLGNYGSYFVPAFAIFMIALVYFVFLFPRTKGIGQAILFSAPGTKRLIMEMELARFGYLLGTLLQAGIPITKALDSLASATEFFQYRKLYRYLRDSVDEGNSFQKSFKLFHRAERLVPVSVQQLIIEGERAGSLAATLAKIGNTFEEKADTTAKNLTIILEPVMLVIVWLGVLGVALAVILPIYSLIGGLSAQ